MIILGENFLLEINVSRYMNVIIKSMEKNKKNIHVDTDNNSSSKGEF